jgi:hypothetical protein
MNKIHVSLRLSNVIASIICDCYGTRCAWWLKSARACSGDSGNRLSGHGGGNEGAVLKSGHIGIAAQ